MLSPVIERMIIDCHNHVGVDLLFYLRGEFPYAQHLSAMISEGRTHGVDRWIVFPMVSNLALNVAKMRQGRIKFPGEFGSVPYAFENRRMLQEVYELFPDLGKLTLPFVMLDPMRATKAQAKELRKLRRQYKFFGLKIQSTILQADINALTKQGRCFLELAEDWDIPFLIHSSVNPSDKWAQAKDILRIAEANPNVRFCLAHSCRFDKECLDRVNELPNAWFDNSAHCIHCDCAVKNFAVVAPKQRRFDSDYSKPEGVIADLAAAYPNKFMWGSDSPFYSYVGRLDGKVLSLTSSYEKEVKALRAQRPDVIQKIAERNTLAFLKLKR
jgi:predicted TIM-barrel fold metal-dependent hydrolase